MAHRSSISRRNRRRWRRKCVRVKSTMVTLRLRKIRVSVQMLSLIVHTIKTIASLNSSIKTVNRQLKFIALIA